MEEGRERKRRERLKVRARVLLRDRRGNGRESGREEEDEESGMMPPHEYLAKSQKRRSRKSGGGASVFEGVGKTLKGRELRRVRDAIWSQTGFYG